ncbi:MAG: hypothetical protein MAG458_00554 [Nitrosopumilus sp.]|nr:hypothetical protein [Nitrosopumilus sp.]
MTMQGFKPQWKKEHSKIAKEFEEALSSKKVSVYEDYGDFMKWLNDKD